jgi:hypothetical protein
MLRFRDSHVTNEENTPGLTAGRTRMQTFVLREQFSPLPRAFPTVQSNDQGCLPTNFAADRPSAFTNNTRGKKTRTSKSAQAHNLMQPDL